MNESSDSFAAAEDALHEAAAAQVGFDDFGDPGYRDALRTLLEALDASDALTPMGRVAARAMITGHLAGRLHSERGFRAHPEAAGAPIETPLVIIGLARTGTSALHHLLACDPARQGLELWLANTPKPRPPREAWDTDPEFQAAVARQEAVHAANPEMMAIHQVLADQVDECWYLLSQDFLHSSYEANFQVPAYAQWWATQDMGPAYRRHRRNLQLIGHRDGRPWLLKDSTHLFDLGAFLDVYPDARVIHTHRDPVPVIASTCSLCWVGHGAMNDTDPADFGATTLALWGRAIDATLAAREGRDPARFYDLHFDDFQRDPIAAVAAIYDHFGLPFSGEAEAAMRAHRAANPKGKHGDHRYDMATWSLDPAAIRERFARYVDHFGIATEARH